jgi:hypothetical protein
MGGTIFVCSKSTRTLKRKLINCIPSGSGKTLTGSYEYRKDPSLP